MTPPPPSRGRSLRGRLLILLAISLCSALAVGTVLVQLYRRSSVDQVARAGAVAARACGAIEDRYAFYSAGWTAPPADLAGAALRRDLTAAVQLALAPVPGVEGGIWQAAAGSLAYAYPTYEGTGPKTDLPAAEAETIRAANETAGAEDRGVDVRRDGRAQTLLLHACPLPGPIGGLTAWTMTRVAAAQDGGYARLLAGLAALLASLLASAGLTAHLLLSWSRKLGAVEAALLRHGGAEMPALAPTGERELDRIVASLNAARIRIAELRAAQDGMARRMAETERLAALGRVAAGVAHEIRNPIAAMRLRAENALAGDDARRRAALEAVLGQIARLDSLLRNLLTLTRRAEPALRPTDAAALLAGAAEFHAELAARAGVSLSASAEPATWPLDPDAIRRALDNLVLNAIQNAGAGARVRLSARIEGGALVLAVADDGPGVPESVRPNLFEPFVTGRADGAGLGLSIVREIAAAHGGTASWRPANPGSLFELTIPARGDG